MDIRLIKKLQEIKLAEEIQEGYHCNDCQHYFTALKHTLDPVEGECPRCGSDNYTKEKTVVWQDEGDPTDFVERMERMSLLDLKSLRRKGISAIPTEYKQTGMFYLSKAIKQKEEELAAQAETDSLSKSWNADNSDVPNESKVNEDDLFAPPSKEEVSRRKVVRRSNLIAKIKGANPADVETVLGFLKTVDGTAFVKNGRLCFRGWAGLAIYDTSKLSYFANAIRTGEPGEDYDWNGNPLTSGPDWIYDFEGTDDEDEDSFNESKVDEEKKKVKLPLDRAHSKHVIGTFWYNKLTRVLDYQAGDVEHTSYQNVSKYELSRDMIPGRLAKGKDGKNFILLYCDDYGYPSGEGVDDLRTQVMNVANTHINYVVDEDGYELLEKTIVNEALFNVGDKVTLAKAFASGKNVPKVGETGKVLGYSMTNKDEIVVQFDGLNRPGVWTKSESYYKKL